MAQAGNEEAINRQNLWARANHLLKLAALAGKTFTRILLRRDPGCTRATWV
jgi:hypothetical protein